MKTSDFLDALRKRLNLPSDYALAPVLGVTRSQVSKYRVGKDAFDDARAEMVAEMLGLDPAFVLASCHAERARVGSQKQTWERIAAAFAQAAAVAALAVGLAAPASEAQAAQVDTTDYAHKRRRERAASAKGKPRGRTFGLVHRIFGRFPMVSL